MTVVEIWDSDPVDNIMGAIALKPDRVVYVGFDKRMMERRCGDIQRLFDMKNMKLIVEYRAVPSDLYGIVDALQAIASEDDCCAFDVLGGEGMILAAMGIVYERMDHGRVSMHCFNVRKGVGYDCISRPRAKLNCRAVLTVEENVVLHGGTVKSTDYSGKQNEEDISDGYAMWDICRGANTAKTGEHPCAGWNKFCGAMASLDTLAQRRHDGSLSIDMSSPEARRAIYQRLGSERLDGDILDKLCRSGLLIRNGDELRYKNDFIRHTFTKAGNLLEFVTLAAALASTESDGSPSYTSCVCGATIGWDDLPDPTDTVNEVDVILMRGMTPVFISCKNGSVDDEELYKLDSVARRFGGRNAVKVMIATYMGDMRSHSDSFEKFCDRASDMGIKLIFDVDSMDRRALERVFLPVNLFSVNSPGTERVPVGGTYAGYKWQFE